VAWALVFTVGLLLLPSLYFGIGGNFDLLKQWSHQEFSTQTGQAEIWFPSQSLRGVLMRYLTVIDYTQVPDSNYPLINIAAVDAGVVRLLWMVSGGLTYCAFLLIAARGDERRAELVDGLAFALLVLLEPFSQKYTFVVLLWPAMVAARVVGKSRTRVLLYFAVALAFIQPLVNGAAAQRLEQVLGFDFLAAALLAAFLAVSLFQRSTERCYEG
jgi:hypothetical protein